MDAVETAEYIAAQERGPGTVDDIATRPGASSETGSDWLELVGGDWYVVRYWRPVDGMWVGTCRDKVLGVGITGYGHTLEFCRTRVRLEIAARVGVTL